MSVSVPWNSSYRLPMSVDAGWSLTDIIIYYLEIAVRVNKNQPCVANNISENRKPDGWRKIYAINTSGCDAWDKATKTEDFYISLEQFMMRGMMDGKSTVELPSVTVVEQVRLNHHGLIMSPHPGIGDGRRKVVKREEARGGWAPKTRELRHPAEARALYFVNRWAISSLTKRIKNHPQKGRGYGHVIYLNS